MSQKLYESYKSGQEDFDKFVFSQPTDIWQIRILALAQKEKQRYEDDVAPVEYALLKEELPKQEYEKLVIAYREEYLGLYNRDAEYSFFLPHNSDDILEKTAKEFVLEGDEKPIKILLHIWQKKIDLLYEEYEKEGRFSMVEARMKELSLLEEHALELSKLQALITKYNRALGKLLKTYSSKQFEDSHFSLRSYFQTSYDLYEMHDLELYIKSLQNLDEQRDIKLIRSQFQNKIYQNNKEAELALKESTDENRGDILLRYTSLEQDIVSKYSLIIAKYYALTDKEINYLLAYEPLELYFDSYFEDFDKRLEYYKLLYKGKDTNVVNTPYYYEIYTATRQKIEILNQNTINGLQDIMKKYLKKRDMLIPLTVEKLLYAQEFESLCVEFDNYAQRYITELNPKDEYFQKHLENYEQLQKIDLRKTNVFA